MSKKEMLTAALERMGYTPEIDEDGDLTLVFQMKFIYFAFSEEDPDPFISVVFPKFKSFDEDESALHLAACNKVTRGTKMLKVFVDQTLSSVSASCEFFYDDLDSMVLALEKSFRLLAVARTAFHHALKELGA